MIKPGHNKNATSSVWSFLVLPAALWSIVYHTPPLHFHPTMEVSALYIEYEGRVLLLHRQDDRSEGNCWGVPAGKLKPYETPLECVLRETREETGCDFSGQRVDFVATVYIELDEAHHIVYHLFRAAWIQDPATVAIRFCEHKGFTWVTLAQASKLSLMQDEDVCLKLAYPEYALYTNGFKNWFLPASDSH